MSVFDPLAGTGMTWQTLPSPPSYPSTTSCRVFPNQNNETKITNLWKSLKRPHPSSLSCYERRAWPLEAKWEAARFTFPAGAAQPSARGTRSQAEALPCQADIADFPLSRC